MSAAKPGNVVVMKMVNFPLLMNWIIKMTECSDGKRAKNLAEISGAKKMTDWLAEFVEYISDSVCREDEPDVMSGDSVRGSITPTEFLAEMRDHVAGHPDDESGCDEFCGLCSLEIVAETEVGKRIKSILGQ